MNIHYSSTGFILTANKNKSKDLFSERCKNALGCLWHTALGTRKDPQFCSL